MKPSDKEIEDQIEQGEFGVDAFISTPQTLRGHSPYYGTGLSVATALEDLINRLGMVGINVDPLPDNAFDLLDEREKQRAEEIDQELDDVWHGECDCGDCPRIYASIA